MSNFSFLRFPSQKSILIMVVAMLHASFCVPAQSTEEELHQIDSLQQLIQNTTNDSIRINALSEWDNLIYTFDSKTDRELNRKIVGICTRKLYQTTAKLTAKEVAFYQDALSSAYNNLGIIAKYNGRYDSAISYYEQSRGVAELTGDTNGIANVINNIAMIEDLKGNYLDALKDYHLALKLRQQAHEKSENMINTLNNIGFSHHKSGNYDSAIYYLKRAIDLGIEIDEPQAMIGAYNNLGMVYAAGNHYEEALVQYRTAEKLAVEQNNWMELGNIYVNLGNVYHTLDSLPMARNYYLQSLNFRNKTGQLLDIGSTLNNLALIFQEEKQYDSALTYLNQSLNIARDYEDSVGMAGCLSNIGEIYYLKQDYQQALTYQEKALSVVRQTDNLSFRSTILFRLYQTYQANQIYQPALAIYEEYVLIKDSLQRQANNEAIIHLKIESKYEQQAALDSLRHQDNIRFVHEQLTSEKLKKELWVALLGLALILALSIYVWNRLHQKRKLAQVALQNEVNLVNALMDGQEKERLRIAQELHDGICSSLLAVEIMLKSGPVEETAGVLKNTIRDLRLLSHQITPPDLKMNNLQELSDELVRLLAPGTTASLSTNMHGDFNSIPDEIKVSVFRIIQEGMTNAVKYANATSIQLQLMLSKEQLTLILQDDGIGFDLNLLKSGLGLTNIQKRVQNLGGSLQIDTSPGHGTTILIHVTLPKQVI